MAIPSVGQSTSWPALNAGPLVVNIVKNINKVAVPAIALFAMANMTIADAGPLAYAACIIACTGTGPAAPFCWGCCLAALAIPGP